MIQRIETLVIPIKVLIKFISRLQTMILRRRKKHESFEKKERKKNNNVTENCDASYTYQGFNKIYFYSQEKTLFRDIVLRRTQKNLKSF